MGKVSKISKAKTVAKSLKVATTKKVHKVYTKPRFHRPVTKKTPKGNKKIQSITKELKKKEDKSMDCYKVILKPISSDKATTKMEKENMLTFQVALNATKGMIKQAFEKLTGA